jgi:hypothetical protein
LQAAIARSKTVVPLPEHEAIGLQLIVGVGTGREVSPEHPNPSVLFIEIPLVIAHRFEVVWKALLGA